MAKFVKVLFYLIQLQLIATTAFAQETCKTIADCKPGSRAAIKLREDIFAGKLPSFLNVPLTSDGKSIALGFDQAVALCKESGQRLPTFAEYARLGVILGAKGIEKVCSTPNTPRTTCTPLISVLNPDSSRNEGLIWNNDKYRKPAGDLFNRFWSSSKAPNGDPWLFTFSSGNFDLSNRNPFVESVMCITGDPFYEIESQQSSVFDWFR